MGRSGVIAIGVAAMVLLIIAVDVLVFRDRFWSRLAANVAIVLVFALLYLRFLRTP